MSARWMRGSAEGAAGARTTQTYILGIGASGALLAGAGVALISLVGLVSFDVWPGTPPGSGPPERAQLNFSGGPDNQPEGGTSLSEAAGLLASASPEDTGGSSPPSGGVDAPAREPGPDRDPQGRPPAAPAPTIPLEPPVIEPDSRTGSPGTGNGNKGGLTKGLPKGGKPRTEPTDDPDELDPGKIPQKVLPGRTVPGKSRGGDDEDSSSDSDTTRKGSTRGSSRGSSSGSSYGSSGSSTTGSSRGSSRRGSGSSGSRD